MKSIRAFSVASVLVIVLLFAPTHQAYAGYWGETTASVWIKQQLENAQQYIKGTLLGTLKMTAYRALSQTITSVISGGNGGGAQFITDWNGFLYSEAQRGARVAVRDFFDDTLRGTGSGDYVPARGEYGYGQPSYPEYLRQSAERSLFDEQPVYNLNEYCDDPSQMYATSDTRCRTAYWNPMNNVYGYTLAAQERYASEYARLTKINETRAIANSGYKDKIDKETGLVQTPGSVFRGIFDSLNANLVGAPLQATSPEEFASLSVGTMVNGLLNQAMQQGLARVENEIENFVQDKVNEGIDSVVGELGPAGEFLDRSGVTNELKSGVNRWALGNELMVVPLPSSGGIGSTGASGTGASSSGAAPASTSGSESASSAGGSGGGTSGTSGNSSTNGVNTRWCARISCSNSTCCTALNAWNDQMRSLNLYSTKCATQDDGGADLCQEWLSSAQTLLREYQNLSCNEDRAGISQSQRSTPNGCCGTFWSIGENCRAQ